MSVNRTNPRRSPDYEFLISRKARDLFLFDEALFSSSGDLVFSNPEATQSLVVEVNSRGGMERPDVDRKVKTISPGELNALGLLHEVLHFVIDSYERRANPKAFGNLRAFLEANLGHEASKCLHEFVGLFPPTSVYRNRQSPEEYLAGHDAGQPRVHTALKELLLLWVENRNPAYEIVSIFIDDAALRQSSAYEAVADSSRNFFDTQPGFGPADESLLSLLLAPVAAHPGSVVDQLRFIATEWHDIMSGSAFLTRILNAIDYISEEGKYFLMLEQARTDKSRVPLVRGAMMREQSSREATPVMRFGTLGTEPEAENFSTDLSWMPRLVLIAKNIFVWLDQLSTRYNRKILHLDEIPDEELELLAGRGFTGLWLIGVWKRSTASRKIKNLNGNVEALASAYSLDSYDISPELGGIEAYENLKSRVSKFGIRLASDMVPNHMGIDSAWVINHPDWFLQSDTPPFYNYSFTGPDLSSDDRVGIFVEDGYWTKTDAGVVFKRLDRWTGGAKYIYHGNDGTHMPWNDTAQLDFTKPEVREAVIQTILHVARSFPIIRFDAAMVLTRKHYQRLWFPEPGAGGAIPSRSHFSMTKDQFDSVMPAEFWREVVDRVQKEVPDTLLLAEAFWLMEGYFVRTLGMHRVYNSAFMNMLKQEENANYRQVIKNVLEYNPQILKRFVNFQNNPDEDTAIAQFGKDDKYFGVCTMMVTMPGLPMFGHGQIEGYTEKYGMEYRRPARNEYPDAGLVRRHENEIFPLLRKRQAFSEVANFLLYDFSGGNGAVNEDVFAYSNRNGPERSLVIYNNRYAFASGWIKVSVAIRDSNDRLIRKTLVDGLDLDAANGDYIIFRDQISGLEYIRPVSDLKRDGLYVELGAFKYNVFMEFRQVQSSTELPYHELCDTLNGRGVLKIEDELMNYKLRGIHAAFFEAVNSGSIMYLLSGIRDIKIESECADVFEAKLRKITDSVRDYYHGEDVDHAWLNGKKNEYLALISIPGLLRSVSHVDYLTALFGGRDDRKLQGWRVLFPWLFLDGIGNFLQFNSNREFDPVAELRLSNLISNLFSELGVVRHTADDEIRMLVALLQCRFDTNTDTDRLAKEFLVALQTESVRNLIGVHSYDGIQWFNKEKFEEFASYFVLVVAVKVLKEESESSSHKKRPGKIFEVLQAGLDLVGMGEKSRYQFDSLLSLLGEN